jgi:preprotein translocase subunit SecY
MVNILSSIPSDITGLFEMFVEGKSLARGAIAALIILAVILVTVVLVIVLNDATRRIPVQYAKKMQGRKMVGGQSTFIPLKVNTAGVIPVIFASSLMSIPQIIVSFSGANLGTGVGATLIGMLSQSNWFNFSKPVYSVGLILYIALIIFFAYFYTSITFNPIEVADNMKKQGGFIPGIRPGKPTTDYLNKILGYIVFLGAVGLIIVVLVPVFFNGVFGASVSFGGTSIIIIVGVILETLKQIESKMLVRNYKGFLQK